MTREPLLIVDGYNLLHAWPVLVSNAAGNLEAARQRLADRVADYEAVRGYRALIVFDGSGKGPHGPASAYAVDVQFSPKGLSADHVIERLIVEWRERTDDYLPITVVTSDRLIHALAMRERATVVGAREFVGELDLLRTDLARYGAAIPFRVQAGDAARVTRKNPPAKPRRDDN